MYNEPYLGKLEGGKRNAIKGVGTGVKGFVAHSTLGISNSVSKVTGTLYLGLRGMAGRYESESNLENPQNIPTGFVKGAKGLVVELGKGVTGVVTIPKQRMR